jgi:hypothetical protein
MSRHPVPPADELTYAQYSGWACCYCGNSLMQGGRSVGRAQGKSGAHDLSIEVYACDPVCAFPKRKDVKEVRR